MTTYFFPSTDEIGNINIFSWSDLIIAPAYVYVVYKILFSIYEKKYKHLSYGKYFLTAMQVKLACAVIYWAVNKFYYKGGDTFVYYWHIIKLRQLLFEDPTLVYNVFFNNSDFHTKLYMQSYFVNYGLYIYDKSSYIVILVGYIVSFFTFFSYINTSVILSVFALFGCWRLFKMFREMYPHLEREMAIATLFIPSVMYWGCGIMKDSICVGFLGILTYSTYQIFFKREKIFVNLLYVSMAVFSLIKIKVYIILAFGPALAVWIFSRYRANIKSPIIKAIVTPIFVIVGGGAGFLVLSLMGSYAERYALDEMMRTAKDTQNWLVTSSQMSGGSFYTLGDIDYSAIGLLKIFPKAINVALFRPYIWEARKIMLVPAAIEGIFTMFLTVRLLFRTGFFRFIKMVAANAEVQFCLIFSIIFAFAVGFTSFNFGALARYKIPFMPFYYIALFILSDSQKNDEILIAKNKK
ncbi:MAG: hypothetical protein U0U67_07235 [Chitinophagales bacterium]